LTTKRNIKSYFYSKLKPKYNAVWKTEIFNDRPGKQYGGLLKGVDTLIVKLMKY
jgi:hypothetical protein